MLSDDSLPSPRRRVPHYALQTVCNSAPEFANAEQDQIRNAFTTGGFRTTLRESVPVGLAPDSVNMLRRQKMARNRNAETLPKSWSRMTQLWGTGSTCPEHEYIPDEFERREAFERAGRQVSVAKREKISNSEWRNCSQEVRLKHEQMILDPRKKEPFPPRLEGDWDAEMPPSARNTHGFLRQNFDLRDWNAVMDSKDRRNRLESTSSSSFLAGRGSGLEDDSRSSRMTLPMIVHRLQTRLESDWEDATVIVSVTEQDLVQIAFDMSTADSERGVIAYMAVLARDIDLLARLGLRKVSQLWGIRRDFSSEEPLGSPDADLDDDENVWMFFLLVPKWVRMRPTDAYYTVHPRSEGSAFRMSTAGSSVLLSLGGQSHHQLDGQATPRRALTARAANISRTGFTLPTPRPEKVNMLALEAAVSSLPSARSCSGAPT